MALVDDGLEILSEVECRQLLVKVRVGRVVIAQGGLAAVFPVNCAVVGGDILFFTGEGTKLDTAAQGATVTFEADEIDLAGQRGWSVLAVGTMSAAPDGLRSRVEALGVYPWAGGERHHLVRIRPDVLTGRRIARA